MASRHPLHHRFAGDDVAGLAAGDRADVRDRLLIDPAERHGRDRLGGNLHGVDAFLGLDARVHLLPVHRDREVDGGRRPVRDRSAHSRGVEHEPSGRLEAAHVHVPRADQAPLLAHGDHELDRGVGRIRGAPEAASGARGIRRSRTCRRPRGSWSRRCGSRRRPRRSAWIPVSVPAVSMCVDTIIVSSRVPGSTETRLPISSFVTSQPSSPKRASSSFADGFLVPRRAIDRHELQERAHEPIAVDRLNQRHFPLLRKSPDDSSDLGERHHPVGMKSPSPEQG